MARLDRHPMTAVLAALFVAAFSGLVVAVNARLGLGIVLAALGGLILWWVPSRWLPTLSLAGLFYLPVNVKGMPVGTLPIAVWVFKESMRRWEPKPLSILVPTALFGVWLVLSGALATTRSTESVMWLTLAILLFVVVPLIGLEIDPRKFAADFAWLTAPLAIYAGLEAWVFQGNPIFSMFYSSLEQNWSTYRATSSFPHPLVAGSVFAAAAAIQFGRLVGTAGRVDAVQLGLLVCLALGVVSTQSRSAAIAVVIAWLLTVLASRTRGAGGFARKAVVVGSGAILVAIGASVVAERWGSDEAQMSATARGSLLNQIWDAGQLGGVTGIGPGASEVFRAQREIAQTALESSYIGLALGIGIVGLVLYAWVIATACLRAWKRPAFRPLSAGLVAISVSMGFYSALDNNPGLLIVTGLLVSVCVSGKNPTVAAAAARSLSERQPEPAVRV